MNYIISFIFGALIIGFVIYIYATALQWIHKLEETQCKCSEDFKRDYMKYYIYIYFANIIFIAISLVFISLYTFLINKKSGDVAMNYFTKIYKIIQFVMPILMIINIVFSIMYIYNLKQIDCKCSEDTRREVYYIWNIISAVIIGINILFIVAMGIFMLFITRKIKK